ncbi:MAG: DUF3990 domain-containing protein [Lachnospiraceae bacterium]|nr:DUF3990 domain-containing protein [Lachnospiraceae bacterium]
MNKKVLYHGSVKIIKTPVFGYGRSDNDYGRGFYCTEDIELAREWAALDENGGFVNQYELDTSGLNCLDLTDGKCTELSWMAILLANRVVRLSSPVEKRARTFITENFLPDTSDADIIIGHRADDSYFSFARAFLSNTITLQQLSTALSLGDLGRQIMLKSERAFNALLYKKSEPVNGAVYYPKRMMRDKHARDQYMALLEKEDETGLYISDIMKKGGL